ncbi:MAG: gamma carbonic anhydrase family protein [Deltaproteobacteria bacterium]|nr:gamma carbonic anhydrase family protein [Deltaproteobacteria bacterium]
MEKEKKIKLGREVRLGQNVVITERVMIGDYTSVWHNVVLRGDVSPIIIGENCNIQDNTVLHGQLDQWDVILGDRVSVGHSCILHGCELSDESFIGMGSIIMNGCYIGTRVMVAAGSLVPQGSRFTEPNKLVMGRPAKVVRDLKQNEIDMITDTPKRYLKYANQWLPVTHDS